MLIKEVCKRCHYKSGGEWGWAGDEIFDKNRLVLCHPKGVDFSLRAAKVDGDVPEHCPYLVEHLLFQ